VPKASHRSTTTCRTFSTQLWFIKTGPRLFPAAQITRIKIIKVFSEKYCLLP
jgi:hypothetical protein